MRVIAGRLGGRLFNSPGTDRTHPMSDKIRGALFNTLGDISYLRLLDAFTGSGALAFEALSRGASHVTALDVDANAIATVIKNASQLALGGELKPIRVNAAAWLQTSPVDTFFDIVLCDPPYDDPQLPLIADLAGRVKPAGLLVASLPAGVDLTLPGAYGLVAAKTYGDASLYFYRREG
ncbi:MAG: RsmD family RNA methyltransferase [Candidatus Saccharibacteria bacterium]